MADIGQVLATGGTTIVAVAVGSGLTYWFGALNRQRQEEREDRTRWYDARREAYVAMIEITSRFMRNAELEDEDFDEAFESAGVDVSRILATIHIVGSHEAIEAADNLNRALLTLIPPMPSRRTQNIPPLETTVLERVGNALDTFEKVARRDLGNPPASS